MVELLIRAGAKVNVEDCNGITPLIEMAKCGNSANLEVLLNHGAIVDHKIWKDGSTALFWALADGHDICSSILIARGADCRGVDFVMNTPLLVCVTNYVEASLDDEASTDLHQRYTSCISVLLAAGAEVDATNKDGKTPLLVLCRIAPDKDEHLACDASVCALLQAGAKVNSRTPKGYEPIHYAAVSGNAPLVRLLVQHGADVNSKGPEGFTPLDYIVNKLSRRGSASIVHMSMLDATGKLR
jgi:cytohesin